MHTSVSKPLPLRALVISVAAMAIPLLAGFVAPEWMTSREGVLVWLTALVPAFLLAYYKGWHGASVALALGMATLTSAHVALLLLGHVAPNWTLLFGVVLVYIGVSLGLGVFADLLHRARHEAEQLIQRAVYGIFRTSPEGRFLMVNPAMVRILGYDSEEELLALDSAEMVYADPSQRAGMVQRFIAAEHVERFPVQWICKDGEVVSLLFSGRPVKDDSGDVVCLEFMVEDVTDRRILEEQLRQAQRLDALGQLAGGVAHDFNNILSVIIVEAQLGMRRLGEGNPLRERFSEIKQAGDRAAELTQQLLAFSRKQIVEPTVVNINRLISGMSTMLGRLISADIELSSELDETLGHVLADKGQLEQIMANLVVNARDAMPRGGQLTIRTLMMTPTVSFQRGHPGLQAEALVVLEIQDSGTGIPDEVKAKIFDPFFTTKKRGKGTGLGLATVYGIVQKMGGEIEVESTLGAGTTVRIYLPLTEEAETEEVVEDEASRSRGCETVMVVDDDARLRRIAVQLLEEDGYTVMSCEDGQEALGRLESYDDSVHLILTDVIMPNMGGRELVEHVQELRPWIKVLFMSGYTDDEVLDRRIATRGISFLQKPFTAGSLASAVRNVLDEEAS